MVKRGGTLYVLVDTDPHRDDSIRTFESGTRALIEAQTAVNAQLKGSNRTFSDELNDPMRVNGWVFFVTIGEEGRSVSVRKAVLE